ncbi:MAG TPA: T9SS type A sorting domain-containing protein [Caldithrix abyssi]|uniref:T9SS type A sorting domain-containing protein n=1 Tax=Caldithrix abyssi TaxID=187145 RepID=A0A7V4WVN6_CALAY|nr:T9SS type A sorting domain-containing protein [Caldithrix abyssi]
MKKSATILTAMLFLVFMAVPMLAQDFVADGYTKILELNEFDGAPHWPIVADEVHAGYDLDQDGNLEFIFLADHSNPNGPSGAGWSDGHSVYVYEWNGSAFEKMWSWADTSLKTGGASFPTMAVADLDGDGNQEIVLGMPSGSNWPAPDVSPTVIYIFEFSTDGGPAEPTASWTANSDPGSNTRPSGMAAGDIDGDGVQEVAVGFRAFSTASTNDALMIFSIDGGFAGDFTQFKTEMIDTTGDWGSVYAVDITDLDNDGNLEAYFSTDNHTIYEASGADTYTLNYVQSPSLGAWTIQGTVQADIDGDGMNELVWGHWSSGALRILRGISDVSAIDSTNEAEVRVVEPGGCRGLTAGDFDKDGNLDIFMGGNYAGSVWRIEYKGTGDIADSNSYTYEKVYQDTVPGGGARVYSVSFPGDNFALKQGGTSYTDMNKNGKPELLIAYEDGDSLQSWIVMVENDSVMTGIAVEPGRQVLKTYTLHQNYPNPFNPTTTIAYELATTENISLKIYDVLGREVKTLVNGVVPAGKHTISWDGTNNAGNKVSSGVYIYSLEVGNHKLHKRMTLMK